MKRWIRASRNFGDEHLMGHWSDGTEYEGDLTGLVQDIENHYDKARLRGNDYDWKEYHRWLRKTAALFGDTFRDPVDLENWAFDRAYDAAKRGF